MRRCSRVPRAAAGALLAMSLVAVCASLLPGGAAGQARAGSSAGGGVASIDADDLRRHVGVLAHDSMRGRETPSPELEAAERWVADRFRAFGLRPGLGEEGYRQRYPLTRVQPGSADEQQLVLTGPEGRVRLAPGRDFVAAPTGKDASADARLTAWRARRGSAPGTDGVLLVSVTPRTIGSRIARVREALRGSDAAGAVLVVDAPDAYFDRVREFFGAEQTSLGEPDALGKPVVLVRRGALPSDLEGGTASARGWSARILTRASVEGARASNVVGWVQGSDPDLRNQYVVFTAHLDHLGVGAVVDGDSIYNGADDDASGVAAVLELAQAFATAASRPRRSVVFVAFTGEEKGLLGSRWYAEHPVFGLSRTVAAFNMDMIGRGWRDTVAAVGKDLSSLGETVDEVAAGHPELGLTVVGDRWPEENLFRRSDQYHLARKGVPALFFFSGLHEDYHEPSDETGELDYAKTARIVRLIYLTGRRVADADRAPGWNPGARERVVEDAPDR